MQPNTIEARNREACNNAGSLSQATSSSYNVEAKREPPEDVRLPLGSGGIKADEDPFLHSITATAGPAAYYKENRISGLYKKVCVPLSMFDL